MKIHANAFEATKHIQSHQRIFVQGQAATPNLLIEAICQHARQSRTTPDPIINVEWMHLHTVGPADYANEEFKDQFKVANLFVGANLRSRMKLGSVDYLPCLLSDMPALIRSGRRPVDVALIQVSPPDERGYFSLGTSVDATKAAVDSASIVIAQINPQMPRTFGDTEIHQNLIHHAIIADQPLPESIPEKAGANENKIAELTASLIENGSTLQMGIGCIPDAVLSKLKNHRHLGIHTEMWTDGALDLIKSGAVDNSKKEIHRGKTVATFVVGSQRLYQHLNQNKDFLMLESNFTNDPRVIAQNPKVVAINSAIEVDLTGQVCADSIGHNVISGVGGQMDFILGASFSEGGKPIIALTSRTKKGQPRIVQELRAGAGVVTTRAHVHYIITEYGIADLYGKTLGERARALIEIAHPDDRENLTNAYALLY